MNTMMIRRRAGRTAVAASLRPFWRGLLRSLLCWHERARQRRELARLDDRLLRDIGLSRVDALQEAGKPFWRP